LLGLRCRLALGLLVDLRLRGRLGSTFATGGCGWATTGGCGFATTGGCSGERRAK
jgi:hypothetical protein